MTDLIQNTFAQYEQRMTDNKDGLAFQKIWLDEVVLGEERMLCIEAIAKATKYTEQIYIEWETICELYDGLEKISEWKQAYLLYHYGFTDDTDHTLIGMAIHFNLWESRAKKLERIRWTTSGCGAAMVVLVHVAAAGREFTYTSAAFSGQLDFSLCENPDFVHERTKFACPTAAKK